MAPDPVDPSPKVQAYAYGEVPPDVVAEKETTSPTAGNAGEDVKSAVRAGDTTTDFVALSEAAAESLTVRLTAKVAADPNA